MNSLPKEIAHNCFIYLNQNDFINYRLVSKDSKKLIELIFNYRPIKCNNRIEHLQFLQHVKIIDLQMCRLINDKSLKFLKKCDTINLAGCIKITDNGIKYLKNINKINLSGCYQITDNGIKQLTNVTLIDISYCPRITENGLIYFNKCPTAIINDCPGINQKYLLKLIEMKLLNISKNTNEFKFFKPLTVWPVKEYNKKQEHIATSLQYANNESIKLINQQKCDLFDSIYDTERNIRDKQFMENYKILLPHPKLLNYDQAINRLNQNNQTKQFIENLKSSKIDTLIGGSIGLSCVYVDTIFVPNDIDLYIKNLDKSKLLSLEDIIYKTYHFINIVVVRDPITITWYIQLTDETITTIQINLFNIRSWAEIFISYTTDLTCIGYEILSNQFIYLKKRWENTLTATKHYFSNILNFDFPQNIIDACYKYQKQGFRCVLTMRKSENAYFGENGANDIPYLINLYYNISVGTVSGSMNLINERTPKNCFAKILYEKYYNIDDIAFASSVDYLYGAECPPDIRFLSVYKIDLLVKANIIGKEEILNAKIFLNIPKKLKTQCGKFCTFFNQYYTVGIKCPLCSKIISLESYLNFSTNNRCHIWHRLVESLHDVCQHLVDSTCNNFEYQWYPELFII